MAKLYTKMTIAELKAELKSRGLPLDGTKLDLVKRVQISDVEKEAEIELAKEAAKEAENEAAKEAEMEAENEAEMEAEIEAEVKAELKAEKEAENKNVSTEEPGRKYEAEHVSKWRFMNLYDGYMALKTVFIHPFKPSEHMSSELSKWMELAAEYNVLKQRDGSSAAKLVFNSIDEGEQCFLELNGLYSNEEVYHLTMNPLYPHSKCMTFEKIFTYVLEGDVAHRQIALDNVPENATDQDILELFPDGFNVLNFGGDPPFVKGLATVEVRSSKLLDAIVAKSPKVEILGQTVTVTKLTSKLNKNFTAGMAKRQETQKGFIDTCFSDEERIEKCHRLRELGHDKECVQDRQDIFGIEKIKEFQSMNEEWRGIEVQLKFDTDRRLKEKLSIPESEDIMTSYVKKKTNKPENQQGKEKAQKRPNSAPDKGSSDAKKTRGLPHRGGRGGFSPRGGMRGSFRGAFRGRGGGFEGYASGFGRSFDGFPGMGRMGGFGDYTSPFQRERSFADRANALAEERAIDMLAEQKAHAILRQKMSSQGSFRGQMSKHAAFRAGFL